MEGWFDDYAPVADSPEQDSTEVHDAQRRIGQQNQEEDSSSGRSSSNEVAGLKAELQQLRLKNAADISRLQKEHAEDLRRQQLQHCAIVRALVHLAQTSARLDVADADRGIDIDGTGGRPLISTPRSSTTKKEEKRQTAPALGGAAKSTRAAHQPVEMQVEITRS